MQYEVEFKPKAERDLASLPKDTTRQVLEKIAAASKELTGNVKRLTNFTPEYRLRVGDYRVLFELDGKRMVVYRVRHRKDVYGP